MCVGCVCRVRWSYSKARGMKRHAPFRNHTHTPPPDKMVTKNKRQKSFSLTQRGFLSGDNVILSGQGIKIYVYTYVFMCMYVCVEYISYV